MLKEARNMALSTIVKIIILAAVIATSSLAQTGKGPSWAPTYTSFVCAGTLTINVQWQSSNKPDILLGIDGKGATDAVSLAVASLNPPPHTRPTQVNLITINSLAEVSPCNITIGPLQDATRRYVIHGVAGVDRRIILSVNGKPEINFIAGTGATVQNGKVLVDSGALYVTWGFAYNFVASATAQGQDVIRTQSGLLYFSPEGFRRHFTSHPSIQDARVSKDCCDSFSFASFKIAVQADGTISLVEPRNASLALSTRIQPLLLRHKMTPFKYNGAAVDAEGVVIIALSSTNDQLYLF
jgi:hypothetical protein